MSPEELSQDDLDSLLERAGEAESSGTLDQSEVEDLLAGVSDEPALAGGGASPAGDVQPMRLEKLAEGDTAAAEHTFDLLSDVALNVRIELGRRRMHVEDILRLGEGSVVELDKLAGDPVDILVNDIPVAKGEVLVLNDYFCVRVTDILSRKEALRQAGGKSAPKPSEPQGQSPQSEGSA